MYTLKEVVLGLSENLELIEEATANSDNIAEGELVYVHDGSEDGTRGLTENRIDDLKSPLAETRIWDGGLHYFPLNQLCDPKMIERVMADEARRGI
ncbi:hypothetical protein [Brucella pseudogrignonensis]|uniref:hypothetical protein n=1 Tax=Brucella pseudogrignonensis TaxID=419475 RepID=UPI003D994740